MWIKINRWLSERGLKSVADNEKDAEIEKLKAALKPVMECDTDFDICGAIEEGDIDTVGTPFYAVKAAKRIYNESDSTTDRL